MSTDVNILNGIHAILNKNVIKNDIDIEALEQSLINGGLVQKSADPADKFNEEMKATADKLGIKFDDIKPPVASSSQIAQNKLASAIVDSAPKFGGGSNSSYSTSIGASTPIMTPMTTSTTTITSTSSGDEFESSGGSGDSEFNFGSNGGSSTSSQPSPYQQSSTASFKYPTYTRSQEDQETRDHIRNVNQEVSTVSSSIVEREKREDMKCTMLEEIDHMVDQLTQEEVDLSRIKMPGPNSTYEEVETTMKILRHKYDRSRYVGFAEEALLLGAVGLEELFDGKRVFFGRYQPCLTGYSNQLQVKLRRMRHDTSQIVSGIMQDYNISPGWRMALELGPNMVLYSRMRKQQYAQPSIYSDEDMQRASERIRG